jgi:hypothetical protein
MRSTNTTPNTALNTPNNGRITYYINSRWWCNRRSS